MQEKGRIGDRLRELERAREEQYFARRDRALDAKLLVARKEEAELLLREMAKMRCPRCGQRLEPGSVHRFSVEECLRCQQVWLDRGELEGVYRPAASLPVPRQA